MPTVSLVVSAVNDTPEAQDNSIVVNEDEQLVLTPAMVLANDSDVDGDILTITWIRLAKARPRYQTAYCVTHRR